MQEEGLVAAIDMVPNPSLRMKTNVTIPPQTFAILTARGTVNCDHMGQLFQNKIDVNLWDKHQNLHVVPMVHRVDDLTPSMIPIAAINLGDKEIRLTLTEDLGYLAPLQLDVSEISMATAQETIVDEGYAIEDEDSSKEPYSSFITSPADIEGPQ